MSSLGKFKQSLIVLVLLALLVLVAVQARGETQADVLLLDPTAPLSGFSDPGVSENVFSIRSDLFGGYELSSILIRADSRLAVINRQRVRIGDSIGNARVTAIDPGRVTLEENDGSVEILELHENSVKTLVSGEG